MMLIYLSVNFDFNWTNPFQVRVWKGTMLTDEQHAKKRTNGITPNSKGDLSPYKDRTR